MQTAIAASFSVGIYENHLGPNNQFYNRMNQICYELIAEAFICYEDYVVGSQSEVAALQYIASSMGKIQILDAESYNTLGMRCAKLATMLLKPKLETQALLHISFIFKNGSNFDANKINYCLKRAIKSITTREFISFQSKCDLLKMVKMQAIEMQQVLDTSDIIDEIQTLVNHN